MSKLKYIETTDNNESAAEGPSCSKARKVSLRRQVGGPKRSKRNATRKSKVGIPLNLCSLPSEILEKIIGTINIWHHNRIRATSKRLKDISDAFVMHEFRKALANNLSLDPCSYPSAVLRAIKQATEVYVHSGFESLFCGCILPMLRSSYKDPFCPQQHQINKFLLHFFAMVADEMGDSTLQKSRLLYTLTLMRILKAFSSFCVITSRSLPLHWRTVVELRGPWLGMLWQSKCQPPHHACKHSHLFVILSELLIANIAGTAFKRVWECESDIYVFGNDTSTEKQRTPRIIFTVTVHGSKKISSLLAKCLDGESSEIVWPPKWPNDQFTANVDIICKEATKWGCCKSQHLEFSPFAEHTDSNEFFLE